MSCRVGRSRSVPRAAGLAAVIAVVFAGASFAQGVAPHPPGDPTAPPQQPGAISSEQQKKHAEKQKAIAREADRKPSDKDLRSQASGGGAGKPLAACAGVPLTSQALCRCFPRRQEVRRPSIDPHPPR